MPSDRTVVAILVVAGVAAGFALAGTASAGHGAENGNYTVSLPHQSDHLPGDLNQANASINHFAGATEEVFEEAGAPDGLSGISYIVLNSEPVDFSQCTTQNTAAFGIDRGADNPGTETDVNLLRYMEGNTFSEDGIVVDFYEGNELAAPSDAPTGLNPADEIVAHQGYRSAEGACYTMPTEPGWYQIHGYLNGTSKSGNFVEIDVPSHYFYICECDSEEQAYGTLGPPPGQSNPYGDGGGATPTPTPEPGDDPTPTPADGPTPTDAPQGATPTDQQQNGGGDGGGGGGGGGGPASTPTRASGGGGGGGGDGGGPQRTAPAGTAGDQLVTPTIADGPGFGAALALFALLGAGLVALRRAD